MVQLLKANFARMFRSLVFYLCTGVMLLWGAGLAVRNYSFAQTSGGFPLSYSINGFLIPAIVCLAVFIALFVGAEYSEGTIRNKIIAGHKRHCIYLSNLIVCLAAGLLMCFAFLLAYLGIGIPFLNSSDMELNALVLMLICAVGALISFGALFVTVAMLNHRTAGTGIVCLLLILLLIGLGIYVQAKLEAPEELILSETFSWDGTVIRETKLNPNYVGGTARKALSVIGQLLPGGQTYGLLFYDMPGSPQMLLYDIGVVLCTTLAGMWSFKRKNLK